ncbi:MAG TPA: hypothetical protein PK777_07645, partial [Thermoguttaceae bacterium]|nr:hypothetical protein [Thermoguttaceae bacterium]
TVSLARFPLEREQAWTAARAAMPIKAPSPGLAFGSAGLSTARGEAVFYIRLKCYLSPSQTRSWLGPPSADGLAVGGARAAGMFSANASYPTVRAACQQEHRLI